jgi:predicted ATP-dependent protease
MACSIASALTGMPVDRQLAMTGEITLRGNVLPIGGLKEKALAAHRGGIKRIVLPKENENEIEDVPATVREGLELIPVAHVDEVLFEALICQGPRDFEAILDRRATRDELLFPESERDEEGSGEEGSKEKPESSGVVTH